MTSEGPKTSRTNLILSFRIYLGQILDMFSINRHRFYRVKFLDSLFIVENMMSRIPYYNIYILTTFLAVYAKNTVVGGILAANIKTNNG